MKSQVPECHLREHLNSQPWAGGTDEKSEEVNQGKHFLYHHLAHGHPLADV